MGERNGRLNALFANKRGDRLTQEGEAAKMISLYYFGGWADPGYAHVLKARLKILREMGVDAIDETVREDLPPLDSDTVEYINRVGIDKLEESMVARVFGTESIPDGGVVHTAPDVKIVREWGLEESVGPVETDTHLLYTKDYRPVLLMLMSKYLQRTKSKIPVHKTKFVGGRIKGVELKENDPLWKKLRIHLGMGDSKKRFLLKLAEEFLSVHPQYSSKYEQDLIDAADVAKRRADEIEEGRKRRKLEKQARKKHNERKAKETNRTPLQRSALKLKTGGN